MGHESRIELWSPNSTAVLLCWFRNQQASLRTGNENRWEKNPQSLGPCVQQPSTWRGRSEQTSLHQVGCEARKTPASAEVFFLDFSFYRTYQDLRHVAVCNTE